METVPHSTEWKAAEARQPRWLRVIHGAETGLAVAVLGLMVLLPCAEILLRKVFHSGVPGSSPVVQHLVLLVSMVGGAMAARQGRLLAISTISQFLEGRWQAIARSVSHGFAAAVCVFLAAASVNVVRVDWEGGQDVAWGIPRWVIQLCLPIGYALIAGRLIVHGGKHWRGRWATAGWTGLLALVVLASPLEPSQVRWPAVTILLVATALGAPLFTTLGGAALIFFWSGGEPTGVVPLSHLNLATNPTLPSIPLFTLAGYFLAEGGAGRRLVAVFDTWFGGLRGGPALVTVLVCAFFTSFTGASGVTILALGALLMPILLSAGYEERDALGLLTAAGSLGLLFPPCLPPILYSIVASSSGGTSLRMEEMFQGGLLPGLLLMALVGGWGIFRAPALKARRRFDPRAAWSSLWVAKWELLVPVVAIGTLFSGLATPVEAAAATALLAFVVETFVYRDLRLVRDVPRVVGECGLLVGGVMLILGVAMGFTQFLIDAQIPDQGVAWVQSNIQSQLAFLLALNAFLLVVGCLMDIYSAIVVVVPLMVPIGQAFGIDMVHLGVVFLANLELGFLTPPVGMNLFLSSYRFNKPLMEVARSVLPLLLLMLAGVLLITYVPWLTTWLPAWFKAH